MSVMGMISEHAPMKALGLQARIRLLTILRQSLLEQHAG